MLNAAIKSAVREIIRDVTERRLATEIAIARGVERIVAIVKDDEPAGRRIARENVVALREMAALGNGRDAAMRVARRHSDDPLQREVLAHRWRRLRRMKK
jgi:hypothetical protein